MNADRTDQLIARAVAALPYRRPRAGFSARVLAAAAAAPAAVPGADWRAFALKGAGIMLSSWTALLAALAAGPVYAFVTEAAPLLAEPGALGAALSLLGARGALLLVKVSGFFSLASDLGAAAAAALPPVHEIALASLACAAVIRNVFGGRRAAQRV